MRIRRRWWCRRLLIAVEMSDSDDGFSEFIDESGRDALAFYPIIGRIRHLTGRAFAPKSPTLPNVSNAQESPVTQEAFAA